MATSNVTFRFGGFELDTTAYELRRKGRRIRLARQPMDLILLMLERPGALVSREEIRKRLWSEDVFVDVDASIRTAVLKIRQVLGDSGESPRFVETVTGKGYRFIAPVEVVASNTSAMATASAVHASLVDARRHNLPSDLTSFVGRETPLAELRRLLSTSRLLSLTGSGGVGKTRLAIRLASDLTNEFAGGVWLVDLASLVVPDLISQAVAIVFGVRESPERSVRDALVDYLRDRELLLLLDTCEHLIDGCAELAEALLRAAPALRILATSREALGVPGETVYRVPSLSVPEGSCSPEVLADFEATALFVERATAVQPDFEVDRAAADAIAAISRRLHGIPLAIELAAAQITVLSPQQIETRLLDGYLTAGRRTSVVRQRTLDATVQWSHQLLSEGERLLFSRLSVFPASWTLEAAEHVCAGDGIDRAHMLALLSRLVGKSLLNLGRDALGNRRYHFVETIRHYARERLKEAGATNSLRDHHFAFFHSEFRDGLHTLTGPRQAPLLRRLQADQENVRAALEWGLSTPALGEKAVELAGALFWFWTKRGLFAEGRHWLERAATVPSPRVLKAQVALGLGHMDYFQGRHADMMRRNDEVLMWIRETGDAWLLSRVLFGHGLAKFECGAFEDAAAYAVAARDAAGSEGFNAPLLILGNLALVNGDHDRALALFEEAIEWLRRVGEIWALGILLSLAAGLRILREEFDQARAYASEALSIYRELEDPRGIAWSLDVFAGLIATEGHAAEAARLWGASDALLATVGGTLVPTIGWIRDRYFEPARAALGERAFEAARAEGRAMQPERAIALASRRFDLIVGTEHRHRSAPR